MSPDSRQTTKKTKNSPLKHVNLHWVVIITAASFSLSVILSYFSSKALSNVGNAVAFLILLFFILLGVVFDIVGVAAAAAAEKQFHSMAAKKVAGAKETVWLIRNAEKVSSFCNDVVGDISGIISGATGTVIISRIATHSEAASLIISLVITGLIAAFTIGGKAIGKSFAINHSEKILFVVGKIINFVLITKNSKK